MDSATTVSQPGRFRVDEIHAGNAGEMCRLFEQVFDKPMSPAFWHWKYALSGGHGIGVWDGDELVAHYGGAGVEVMLDGNSVHTVQICDVMVAPKVRNAVRKYSPFHVGTSAFIDRFVGYGKEFLMGFGFPSHRHLRIAEHLGFYAEVGQMSELRFPGVSKRVTDWLYRWQSVEPDSFATYAGVFDSLWQQMQHSLPNAVLVAKNSARVHYRYLQHPEHRYHLWLLQNKFTGKASAAVVLKEEKDHILLMDLVCAHQQSAETLRQAALAVQQRWGQPLVFWLSTSHAQQLQIAGMESQALPISTPANIWSKGPTPGQLMNRWWLTAGDTDFL